MHRKTQRNLTFLLNLLGAVVLSLGTFLTAAPDRAQAGSGVLAGWSMFSFTANIGSQSNIGTAVLSTNASGPFSTSTEPPPGEIAVFIANNWTNGSGSKYWKVHFNSIGFKNLTVSSQQRSTNSIYVSGNGPRDFKLQYSFNDSVWTDVPGSGLTLGSNWISSGKLTNLSLPAALDNQPSVYLRWIMTSNTSVTPAFPITDNDGQSHFGGLYISGVETAQAPTDIQLSDDTIFSGDPAGTLVGNLSVTDPNSYDTWTYSLVSGTGSTNNSSFQITGNQLTTSARLAPGTYSIRVNVNDGTYDYAKAFTITVLTYAPITGGNTNYNDYITNINFAGINHTSGKSSQGYEDFLNTTGTVLRGNGYPFSATVNVGCPNPPVDPLCEGVVYPQYIKVWFDWNQDYDFDEPDEGYTINANTTLNGPHTITVNVPATAALGTTRMRVANRAALYGDKPPEEPPDGGTESFIGEAEDYTINVIGLTITTGTISGSPFFVSAAKSASVNVPYAVTGTYTAGNVFTAYLSNASGDFTSETPIGSRTATDGGTISATIPAGTASGAGYRIRVKSSSPVITGSNNGVNLTITLDTTGPVVTVPANATVEATSPSGTSYSFTATATDAVAPAHPAVTCDHTSGSTFPLGTTTVTCSAVDAVGNPGSSSFTVTVRDSTPPVVTVPANATVEAAGPSGATFTFTTSAADLIDLSTLTVTCDHLSGSLFPLGVTTVTCSAADAAGNTGNSSFTVTVRDTTAPLVTVPANATVEATGPSGATYNFTATAADLVDASTLAVTCDHPSGTTFPLGTTTVICSAKDGSGNTGSASFTVTVRDTTPPVVTVPANATVEATGPAGAAFTFTATAADLVDASVLAVTCDHPSGSMFPLDDTTVACSAADAAGNTSSSKFTVTVRDTTPPVVTVPANETVEATSPDGAIVTFAATATDTVAPLHPAVTCDHPSGGTFPLGATTVNCSATDAAENTSSSSFTVTVDHTNGPVLTVPANATVEATGPDGATFTFTVTAADLVDPSAPEVTCDYASGYTFPLGTTTVTCSATDAVGNAGSGSFTVTVQDTTAPVLTIPANVQLVTVRSAPVIYTFDATATDLVDPANPEVTCDPASGSEFSLGITTVTCTATDAAGNTGQKTFTVTVMNKRFHFMPMIAMNLY